MKYNYKINLASESQRRIDFLNQLKLEFNHFSVDIDESQLEDEIPLNYLSRIVSEKKVEGLKVIAEGKMSSHEESEEKDGNYMNRHSDLPVQKRKEIVIVADTIVVLGDQILQKPKDKEEAKEFLSVLSNRWHNVITGYAISDGKDIDLYRFIQTDVLFKKLSESEIDFYLSDDEYIGKAGAYAIQGLGAFMIKKFVGSYSNVVGLPVMEVFSDLQELKVIEL
jgi:septum formation protein